MSPRRSAATSRTAPVSASIVIVRSRAPSDSRRRPSSFPPPTRRGLSRAAVRRAHLRDRFRFDLPNPLAREHEATADFLERVLALDPETVAKPEHFALAIRKRRHRALDFGRELPFDRRLFGRARVHVAHQIPKLRLFALADRRLERRR